MTPGGPHGELAPMTNEELATAYSDAIDSALTAAIQSSTLSVRAGQILVGSLQADLAALATEPGAPPQVLVQARQLAAMLRTFHSQSVQAVAEHEKQIQKLLDEHDQRFPRSAPPAQE